MNSLKIAEKTAKKTLDAKFGKDKPKDLKTIDLGADEEVKQSLASISESQKELGFKMDAAENS